MSDNGCTCDFCAPTVEDKARAAAIGAKIVERHILFDQWKKLDPRDRPAFHTYAELQRSARRARGIITQPQGARDE